MRQIRNMKMSALVEGGVWVPKSLVRIDLVTESRTHRVKKLKLWQKGGASRRKEDLRIRRGQDQINVRADPGPSRTT
jgi:hypothetical protein